MHSLIDPDWKPRSLRIPLSGLEIRIRHSQKHCAGWLVVALGSFSGALVYSVSMGQSDVWSFVTNDDWQVWIFVFIGAVVCAMSCVGRWRSRRRWAASRQLMHAVAHVQATLVRKSSG